MNDYIFSLPLNDSHINNTHVTHSRALFEKNNKHACNNFHNLHTFIDKMFNGLSLQIAVTQLGCYYAGSIS